MEYIRSILVVILIFCNNVIYSQIGINIDNPHKSSVLDINASDRGLLIPRVNNPQMIATPAEGLVFYNTIKKAFYLYDNKSWKIMLPFEIINDTTVSTTYNVIIKGDVAARSYANNNTGNGPVPKGGIIMWSGSINQIPQGWALCDGTNNTPNLTDRFIVGAGNKYSVGNIGGLDTVNLKIREMPRHNHGGGVHNHNLVAYNDIFCCGSNNGIARRNQDYSDGSENDWGVITNSGQIINKEGGWSDSSPLGSGHENRPPYFALAYIMKL